MATRFSILAWEIPWTEEPGGLQSKRSQRSQTQLSNETNRKPISCGMYPPQLRYRFLCRQAFRLFPCLPVVNSTAVHIGVQESFQITALCGEMPRSGIKQPRLLRGSSHSDVEPRALQPRYARPCDLLQTIENG